MTPSNQRSGFSVSIRALEVTDLDRTLKWHNDPELYATLISPFRHVSRATEEVWLRRRMTFSPTEVNLAVVVAASGAHVGNVYLRDIDWVAKNAALGVFIGERESRGRGYGSQALRLVLRHAFHDLGLHRVYLFALAENSGALATYRKVGFTLEGTLREHAFKAGQFRDVVALGIHADEWVQVS